MIHVDISNVWGCIEFRDLMSVEKEVFNAHTQLSLDKNALSWLTLPQKMSALEIDRVQEAAERIQNSSEAVVVLGVGGAVLSSQSALQLLEGTPGQKKHPEVIYAGSYFNTRRWNALLQKLENTDFSVIWVSRSGTTTETAVAARALRWIMERKYGTTKSRERIYAVTDPNTGTLRQMASDEGWSSFLLPSGIKGRFSALSAAGLLPLAAGGINIQEVIASSANACDEFNIRSYENPTWLYAAIRNLLYRNGKSTEILAGFEPGFLSFGRWWQQLFAASEGRQGSGIFPCYAEYTDDLHTLGQFVQQGPHNLFETILQFDNSGKQTPVEADIRSLDGLDYLVGKTLDNLEEAACMGAIEAHVSSGVPVISIECGIPDAAAIGELFYFFEVSCGLSSYIGGVDPFGQSGTEQFRQNMFRLLGKPGYEK